MIRNLIFLLLATFATALSASSVTADTVRISDYGINPGSFTSSTRQLQEVIEICKSKKARVLVFQPGRYDIWPEGAAQREWFVSNTSSEEECPSKIKTAGLLFEDINGLTVEGNGAELIFHGKMIPMAINNCSDLTVRNLTIDYERPSMSEMRITANEPGRTTAKFHPDSKYHIDRRQKISLYGEGWVTSKPHCIEHDPENEHATYSRTWKTLSESKASDLGDNSVEFSTPENFVIPEGHILSVRDIIRDHVGMLINESTRIALEGLNIHYMHGLGIVSQASRDITVTKTNCMPRPGSGRIIASSADFMHFSGCSGKIKITECNFSGAHDDCINIHGTNMKITGRKGDNTLTVRFMHPQTYGFANFACGDTIAFTDPAKMLRHAYATVKKVRKLSDREYVLTLTGKIPENTVINQDCVENMTRTPEVEISRCSFAHTNTRGILLTTPRKAVISDNYFRKLGMSAILIEGDAGGWYESGPVCDVTIENNVFEDCAYLGGPANAVIALHPTNSVADEENPVHENVIIADNRFITYGNPAVYAKSTGGLRITGNVIETGFSDLRGKHVRNASKPDLSDGIYYGTPFVITWCKDADISDNTITGYTDNNQFDPNFSMWFDRPAAIWEECLPLGDGRLGIMADGGIKNETVVLNDITLWSGSEYDYSNPEAARYLPQIRQLLIEGRNAEAQEMMYRHFVPKKPEKGGTYGSYQVLADLNISYNYPAGDQNVSNYSRSLSLTSGTSSTEFMLDDSITYCRTYSVPRGEDCILIKLTASKPSAISFALNLSRKESGAAEITGNNRLMISGELESGQDGVQGMGYAAVTGVKISGQNAKITVSGDSTIVISDADEAWIGVGAATSYLYGDSCKEAALKMLDKALENPLQASSRGRDEHKTLMDRASLVLPTNINSEKPVDRRLTEFQNDDTDISLAALYYNFGRYLLISSTREDLLPPNLQGLWANTLSTPWNGDYHTNINVQMNHWPAEPANLSELHNPLFELVRRALPSGERTAKAFYGNDAEGWVMHMMTNIWNYTEPGEHPSWGATNTGGAWLCRHIWEHYQYTGDRDFLARHYPAMRGAALFFLSTMIVEPGHGWLVTAPSSSPENSFYDENTRTPVSVCMGPTMDTQIISELWTNVIKASEILGLNDTLASELSEALKKLPPMQVDSEGRLMEWLKEYTETDRHHRHVSHLYGLHPAHQISPESTPELAEAASRTLDARGDEGTGWSRAWKINFHARLKSGDRAWNVLKGLLQPAIVPESPRRRAGSFANLFCSHPPFQIDGNWGATAGIGEMLIQSDDSLIDIFPALPSAMSRGSLRGFRTVGGHTIDIDWDNSLPTQMTVTPGFTNNIKIRLPEGIKHAVDRDANSEIPLENNIIVIENHDGRRNPVRISFTI